MAASSSDADSRRGKGKIPKHLKSVAHVLTRPEMYIDSVERIPRKIYVMRKGEDDTFFMEHITTEIPLGLERLYIEPIYNVCDHADDSRREGFDPGTGVVKMNAKTIQIQNGGCPMPIELMADDLEEDSGTKKETKGKKKPKLWTVEYNFGKLRSGTNYGDVRHGGGTNGLGVKLTNIFSSAFSVDVVNPDIHKRYRQKWNNNMTRNEPVITDTDEEEAKVSITFTIELHRFGYPEGKYPPEAIDLYRRHAADASFSTKMPFYFNGELIDYPSILDYSKLFFTDMVEKDKYILHYEWPEGCEIETMDDGTERAVDGTLPLVEMIVIDAPNKGRAIGLANSVLNQEGGDHVEAAIKAVASGLIDRLNKKDADRVAAKDPKVKSPKLTLKDVKENLRIVVSVRVTNPGWDSQSKNKFKKRGFTITVPEDKIKPLERWQFVAKLKAVLEAKKFSMLTSSDGKKKRFLGMIKGEDASEAGGPRSSQCTLMLMEGSSAKGYGLTLCRFIPEGRKRIGLLPLRGKLLNAYKASPEMLANNKELQLIKKMIGIEEGVDYTVPENKARLRYGSILLMTDADKDGHHIKGLILAMVHRLWGSLLDINYIQDYRTPYLRVKKGKQVERFFFEREYEDWKTENPNWKKWQHQYFKGLGSSGEKQIKEDWENPKIVLLHQDENADSFIEMAFGKDGAESRKRWISNWTNTKMATPINDGIQPISRFINEELIEYSVSSLQRHIPACDGLQSASRKAIFGAFHRWGRPKKTPKHEKLASFISYVSEKSQYHHGDSLAGVIMRMAMRFVGSNNVPYFDGKGNYGSRDRGGKDAAAPRYPSIRPNLWWMNLIFREEDDQILAWKTEEGISIEPEFYLPVIPLIAINGGDNVATGWRSYFPNHHPLDVIDYYISKCNNERPNEPRVWYRGFKGLAQIIDRRDKKVYNSSDDESDEDNMGEFDDNGGEEFSPEDYCEIRMNPTRKGKTKYFLKTTGTAKNFTANSAEVTELPIGLWTGSYRDWLNELRTKKILTKDVIDGSDDINVYFHVRGLKVKNTHGQPRYVNSEDLGLTRCYGLTNLVTLNERGRPVRHRDLPSFFRSYYKWRIPYYLKRKDNLLMRMSEQIDELGRRLKFLYAVVNGQLVIFAGNGRLRKKADILTDIAALELDPIYFTGAKSIRTDHYSEEKIRKLESEKVSIEETHQILLNKTPKDLWNEDLFELREAYVAEYGDDRPRRSSRARSSD